MERRDKRFRRDEGLSSRGKPEKMNIADGIGYTTIKGLQYFNDSITVKADPYSEAVETPQVYPIVNRTNKIVDGRYGTNQNLLGNTLTQVLTNGSSTMQNQFDCAKLDLELSYLYLDLRDPMSPDNRLKAPYLQAKKYVSESISKAYSQTFISLPFFSNTFESTVVGAGSDPADLLLLTSVYYQSVLQNVAGVFNKFNQLLSSQKTVFMMGWNREVPSQIAAYGLWNKAALKAVFNGIASVVTGEYFDVDWFKQTNKAVALLSRKSTSMTDPLLEVTGTTKLPNFKLKVGSTVIWDSETKYKVKTSSTQTSQMTLQQMFKSISEILSVYSQVKRGRTAANATEYYNKLVWLLEALLSALSLFKTSFESYRTVLDVMNRVRINGWKKGIVLNIIKSTDYQPEYNLIVDDIFTSYFSSADRMVFDSTTYRWSFNTIWNKFTGIPTFDRYEGGSFITYSVRALDVPSNADTSTTQFLVPRWFNVVDGSGRAINRLGEEISLSYEAVSNLPDNDTFARLSMLGSANQVLRVPKVDIANLSHVTKSAVYQFLGNLFNDGACKDGNTTNYFVDSDIIGLIDVELDNIVNSMIDFYASRSPFRVSTGGQSPIGFFGN